MVLSTQNPVDLDYKAMSNAGTWCVGRLQTERDKARILEGLTSASGDVDIGDLDATISGLDKRQFLLHQAGAKEPTIFATRWAMSYLRGPLTKEQIADLTEDSPAMRRAAYPAPAAAEAPPAPSADESPMAPAVHGRVPVYFVDPAAPWTEEVGGRSGGTRLAPGLAARVQLLFDDTAADLSHKEEWEAVFFPLEVHFDPDAAIPVDYDERDFRDQAPQGALYRLTEVPLDESTYFTEAKRELKEHLYRNRSVGVLRNTHLDLYSRVGETEEEFRERCDRAAQEKADEETAKMRDRFEAKLERLRDQAAAAELRLQELQTDVTTRRQEEVLDGLGSLLGGLLGGRHGTRSISRAGRRRSQTRRTEQRMKTAEAKLADKIADVESLEEEVVDEIAEINDAWEEKAAEIEPFDVGLEKTDVHIDELAVVWIPVE